MANKIQIRFEAIGDKALRKAIQELAKAQAQLEKNTKNLNKANNALSSANNKATQATNNHARSQKLIKQRVEKNVQAFGKLQSTLAVYRNKLLLAAFAATAFRQTLGSLLDAYAKQEAAERQLSAVLGTRSSNLLKFAAAQQQVTMFGDEVTIQAMSQTAAFIKDEEQIKEVMKASQDLATLFGWDLNTAAQLVTKTIASSTNALQRYGIEVEGAVGSAARFESVLSAVNNVAGGLSEEMAGTYTYEVAQLGNAWGDLKEELGKELAPVITKLIRLIKVFVEALDPENIKRFMISLTASVVAMKSFAFATAGAYTKGKMFVRGMRLMSVAAKTFSKALKAVAWFTAIDFLIQMASATNRVKGGFNDATTGIHDFDAAIEQLSLTTGGTEQTIEHLQQKLDNLEFKKEWAKGWEESMAQAKKNWESTAGMPAWMSKSLNAVGEFVEDAILDWSTHAIAGLDRVDLTDIFVFDNDDNIIDFTERFHDIVVEKFGKTYDELNEMQKASLFRGSLQRPDAVGYMDWSDIKPGTLDFKWDEGLVFQEILDEIERTEDMLRELGAMPDAVIEVPVKVKPIVTMDDDDKLDDTFRKLLQEVSDWYKMRTKIPEDKLGADVFEKAFPELPIEEIGDGWGVDIDKLVEVFGRKAALADWMGIIDIITSEVAKLPAAMDVNFVEDIIVKAIEVESYKLANKLDKIPEQFNTMFDGLNLSESEKLKKQFDIYEKQIESYLIDMIKVADAGAFSAHINPEQFFKDWTKDADLTGVDQIVKKSTETWVQFFDRMGNLHDGGADMVADFFDTYATTLQDKGIANVDDWKKSIDEWFSTSDQKLKDNSKSVDNLIKNYQKKTTAIGELNPAIAEYNTVIESATNITDKNKKELKKAIIAYYEEKRVIDKVKSSRQELLSMIHSTEMAEQSRIATLQSQLALLESVTAAELDQNTNVADLVKKYNDLNGAIDLYAYTLGSSFVESNELALQELEIVKLELEALKKHFEGNAEMVDYLDRALQGVEKSASRLSAEFINLSEWGDTLTTALSGIASAADAAAWSGEHMGRAMEQAIQRMVSIIAAKLVVFATFFAILSGIGLVQTGSLAGGQTLLYNLTGGGFWESFANFAFHKGGKVKGYSVGGQVMPLYHSGGGVDDVPAMLQEGEFVMQRSAVDSIGLENLNRMNRTGQSQSGVNISFSGNVLSRDFIEEEAIPKIKDAIRRGADIGIG